MQYIFKATLINNAQQRVYCTISHIFKKLDLVITAAFAEIFETQCAAPVSKTLQVNRKMFKQMVILVFC